MTKTPDTIDLLRAWELGVGQSTAARGILLMSAASPDTDAGALKALNIGERDGRLLDLREALFGSEVHCLTDCTSCGEPIEVDFRIDDIRVPHAEPGCEYSFEKEGYRVRFRLPDSNDLLALEGKGQSQAERQLLSHCVLDVRTSEGNVGVLELPSHIQSAVSQRMLEVDPQAEILLELSCPLCSAAVAAPFDIASHFWTELDAWARRILKEVHVLAFTYGWSELEILRMGVGRRCAYLNMIGN